MMPLAPPRLCRCGALVRGRCPHCQRDQDQVRGNAAERGYDGKWRIKRAAFLNAHPWCSEAGCGQRATDVDHIIPRRLGGTDVWTNLQPLCHRHHSSRTATEQSGWGRST